MRIIEQEIISALKNESDFQTSVTEDMYRKKEGRRDVLVWNDEYPGIFSLKLWGHQIAKGDTISRTLEISDCGYPTATTKSRLNAVFAALDIPMSCSVRNKKMVYFYKGKEISEKEVETSDYVISIS
jgi:hypothetical protein